MSRPLRLDDGTTVTLGSMDLSPDLKTRALIARIREQEGQIERLSGVASWTCVRRYCPSGVVGEQFVGTLRMPLQDCGLSALEREIEGEG